MRKIFLLVGIIAALAIPTAAIAATWDNHQNGDLVAAGAACEDGDAGAWYHFVNNQTGGAAAGSLTAVFTNPAATVTTGPLAVNQNVQHFYVWAEGTLVSATTTIPGRLVISGIACGKKDDNPRDLFDS